MRDKQTDRDKNIQKKVLARNIQEDSTTQNTTVQQLVKTSAATD